MVRTIQKSNPKGQVVQALRLLLTLAATVVPSIAIMSTMGWTSVVHFALLGACALLATALTVLVSDRHRRPDLRKRTAITTRMGQPGRDAPRNRNVRPVIGTLLMLPGLNYLLLEAVGVTPKPTASGS